jgi:hypothetical protein
MATTGDLEIIARLLHGEDHLRRVGRMRYPQASRRLIKHWHPPARAQTRLPSGERCGRPEREGGRLRSSVA